MTQRHKLRLWRQTHAVPRNRHWPSINTCWYHPYQLGFCLSDLKRCISIDSARLWHEWYVDSYGTYAEKLPTRHNIFKESESVSHKIDTVSLNLKSGYHNLPIHCFHGRKIHISSSRILILFWSKFRVYFVHIILYMIIAWLKWIGLQVSLVCVHVYS